MNFEQSVSRNFQIYNGLLLNLPFPEIKHTAIQLPLFTEFCKKGLEKGQSPIELVESFFADYAGTSNQQKIIDELFSYLRLSERQIVLFDAIEDAAFPDLHDLKGTGSIQDILNQVEREVSPDTVSGFIDNYRVRIVLTAHPTQFYTDQVLSILAELADSIQKHDFSEIHNRLLQLGKTRFKKKQKPSPLDEAQSLLSTLEDVMYYVLPSLHQRLIENITIENKLIHPGIIELGFWPGGDRDGNPFVTAETTLQVADMLKRSIIKKYIGEIKQLQKRLTFDGVSEKLLNIRKKLQAQIESTHTPQLMYTNADDFLNDLLNVHSIINSEHMGLFIEHIEKLIYTVQTFGFHFASIDIRQDSRVHLQAINAFQAIIDNSGLFPNLHFSKTSFKEMPESEKIALLEKGIYSAQTLTHEERSSLVKSIPLDMQTRDVPESILALQDIQKQSGKKAAHRYIISNTQQTSDILAVHFLINLLTTETSVDVVPLFETIEDLHNAQDIMENLYTTEAYREHLKQQQNNQHIMLGFSDGTKDGGYVSANWEIYKAKEKLTNISRKFGNRVLFFDGRGGPPARGGGNTHKFYRSLGDEIDSSSIQLTVQGQTITSTYGTIESATHNIEQLVSAGIENNLFPEHKKQANQQQRELMDTLSKHAREYYLNLKNHPSFLPYLDEITPLAYYAKTNIGSRPSKRASQGSLSLDSLRAIPFVGAWSQMKQNVPGFYGFGTAIKLLCDKGFGEQLKQLYKDSLFFHTLVENSMQSLSKTYYPLTQYLHKDSQYGDFWQLLKNEADLSIEMLNFVSNQKVLLERDAINKQSIALRENLILPVSVIQHYALLKLKDSNFESDKKPKKETLALEKLIIKSLAASINASRNSV